jgi:hypothetical protein
MSKRLLPLLALVSALALVAVPAADARSKYRVGISDQAFQMFNSQPFQALGLKRVRYLVPWNGIYDSRQVGEMDAFLNTARGHGFEPFVTFTAIRGCWDGGHYSRSKRCKAPSVRRYKKAVTAFRARYPQVRVFAPWNEANHPSQPTYRKPGKAAKYYNALKKRCRGCTLLGADVLDISNLGRYLRKVKRKIKGRTPRRWGLHNYGDVNRKRTKYTRKTLNIVPGEVWLTETGGIVKFQGFRYSERRAARRLKYMFRLADRYDTRRRGLRSKITRIYVYQWTGAPRGARFDAGLTDVDGSPRHHYSTFKKKVRNRRK